MNAFRTLVLSMTSIAAFAALSTYLHAQAAAPPSQGPSISVSLALANDHVPAGESPQAVVTMKNIGKETKCFRTADFFIGSMLRGRTADRLKPICSASVRQRFIRPKNQRPRGIPRVV